MGRIEMPTGSWWEHVGKRPHARPRLRWDNNIKIDFEEMG